MRWRINREGLVNDEEYLCEIDGTDYDVLMYRNCELTNGEHYIAWTSGAVYEDDRITKWCPISEIVGYLNTLAEILSALDSGDSGSELHERGDNPCSTH